MRNVTEKIGTHILFSVTVSYAVLVYEIMCKNMVQQNRPQMAV